MLIGYARISTQDQTLALQQDALEKAGCDRIFTDTMSVPRRSARALQRLSATLEKGIRSSFGGWTGLAGLSGTSSTP
jgi:DNA invertase Pin-like site-specific DNA recombinase